MNNYPEIPKTIQSELKQFEKEYNRQLRLDSLLLKPVFKHVLGVQGKRTRPLLFFLFQAIFNQSSESNVIIPVILEMLHEASLIHDDVIDVSMTRRGRKSLNAKFSNKVAVLCGDYLMAKVLELGIAVNLKGMMSIISRTAVNMGRGELSQALSGLRDSASEKTYFNIINDKTAGLFAAACELGCLAGIVVGEPVRSRISSRIYTVQYSKFVMISLTLPAHRLQWVNQRARI